MKNKRTQYSCSPHGGSTRRPGYTRWLQIFVSMIMSFLLTDIASAQDLIINGTATNGGKIRVKNQTTIAQPSLGGEIELKGANQILPAKQYQSVQLTGTGTKTTSGGDLSVQKNLTIASPVTFVITKGNILTLTDTLFESGILKGAIQKSVNLTGSTTSSNFGNIGAAISWSSTAPGITNVIRASDSLQFGNGNQSIKRYYQIQPTDATATGTVVLKYYDSELNGHSASNLQLWQSTDNGTNWVRHVAVVDTLLRTITKTNVALKGRWTMADTVRAIGPLQGTAGIPKNIASASIPDPTPVILSTVDTLKVLITDVFGTPVSNVSVNFAINVRPSLFAGGSLSDSSAITNASGIASTVLTMGSKVGKYQVIATGTNLDTAKIQLTAQNGPAQSIAGIAITPQTKPILTQIDSAFTITVADIGGNPVDSAQVNFTFANLPSGSFGEALSSSSVKTDSLGRASTFLTLGSKAVTYTVRAKVVGVSDSVTFTAQAQHGPAKSFASVAFTPQTKQILSQLDSSFTVTVSDTGGNPVNNAQVQFSLVNIPSGSFGEALSTSSALTDLSGMASTKLTLGSKVSPYAVRAKVTGLTDSVTFTANAIAGPPNSISTFAGNNQSGENGKPLTNPFVVTVLDVGNNPVSGDTVDFTLQSNSFGASLSTPTPTNSLGQASTILTLGTKTGPYTVSAKSHALIGALQFNATALAGAAKSLALIQGNNQSGAVNATLASDFIVRVLDTNGNNVPSATVAFAIDTLPDPNSVGQTLSFTSIVTDTSGLASTRLTFGNKAGDYVVNAAVNGVPTISFKANAKPGTPSSLALVQGNNQLSIINSQLVSDLVVRVLDANGNNVPNTTVKFKIDSIPNALSIGQTLSDTSVNTDVFGLAPTKLTLGNKAGSYVVTARVNTVPILSFKATAKPGAAVIFSEASGSNQTIPIITPLTNEFVVRVADVGGNNVYGTAVIFTVDSVPSNASGYQLRDSSVLSDSNGYARTLFTVGNKIGLYYVKSHAAGLRDTIFTATALHGTAAAIANATGDQQVNPTATMLDTAFTLTVKDIGGNLVPNANVHFAITTVPANATGQSLRDSLVVTDSLGMASTVLSLGTREGAYTVTASVTGSLSSTFTANAYYIYGDPNGDINVNIADITMVIDQIIGRQAFTFVDSVKSDLNKDGKIDTADVNTLASSILDRTILSESLPPFIPVNAKTGKVSSKVDAPASTKFFGGAKTQFEVTPQGLRLNMENTVAVRGLEVRIRLKDTTINVDNANYLFSRAQQMNVVMKTVNNEIRMLAYSLLNSEIQPGDGTILRIPKIISLSQIDTTQVTLSVGSNVAVTPEAIVIAAEPGKYPLTYRLDQNYPNPFNGSTTIQYEIPDARTTEAKIAIQIFNVLGQKVKTLINAPHDPGQYRITWNGTDENGIQVSSGIYFYRLISKNHLTTKKMIYVK